MDIREAIKCVTNRQDLNKDQMIAVMHDIMSGQTTDAQNAAFLVGLQMKGVKASEILGGATVMRELASSVDVSSSTHLVDTCGTGGTGSNKFNVSTASAFVAAAAGARVAKHGNRGATSKSGSADVLEAAGVKLGLNPERVAQAIEQVGVGFMFAPAHHSAMKHVITARKEIGVRTVFNLLGPLTNPASAPNQLMGVFDPDWIAVLLEVLKDLGSNHVMIVAADDGLDEISIASATRVGELKEGEISIRSIAPSDFGIEQYSDYSMLQIADAQESLDMLKQALTGEHRAAADIVALNAGAAIYVANLSDELAAGIDKAREIIDSGAALDKLEELVQFTQAVDG
ncbi:MAG TPA: anthranilate phosphoribosyltransferase [Gammaproteobacteria bacterium]|jgi:anthranilate phosphoribosyltransferase|nr:anthranilate phosphoribosyltransferase [Gammaproteobacteria bacterium]MDP6731838.1 anthranilate phosphoribosyltransferase [Gammaproteobacteria bacterium]HAJ76232.1 anthranilate phosphoribosyltransferase [Gammaproteobacteria bacterium]|tara:strand:+ start:970 stop:1998 length:1029 start_codon:yes stop_codon:yes gene_type:complete